MILKIKRFGTDSYQLFDNIKEISVSSVNLNGTEKHEVDRRFVEEAFEVGKKYPGYQLLVYFRNENPNGELWYLGSEAYICNDEGKTIEKLRI